ncbi:Pre-mRNA-splicing factor prp1 [Apiospora arundinis]
MYVVGILWLRELRDDPLANRWPSCILLNACYIGLRMSLMCIEDEPVTSIERYYAEHVATGEEGADTVYVPPHWHKATPPPLLHPRLHGEYHVVIEGRLEITLDGKITILNAGDPSLYVPPKAVHSIRSFPGERMVAQERADPPGTYKLEWVPSTSTVQSCYNTDDAAPGSHRFFNDALSTGEFNNSKAHLVRALYDGDGYLPLAFGIKPLEEVLMWMIATLARLFAPPKPKTL